MRGRPQAIGPKMERIEALSIHNHTEKGMAGQEETPVRISEFGLCLPAPSSVRTGAGRQGMRNL